MSRAYDAKQQVLKAYPNDRESGIDLFMAIIDVGVDDFLYEHNETPEQYVYGNQLLNED
jgi:hypothetical protein